MIGPARVAAYDILTSVSAGRADLPSAIASARSGLHDERDRALAAEIATGVQRWRAALDHVIAHFSKRPIARLDDEVVEILRLSAYQLLHLTRVPAAAVVDDAVNLAKRAGKTSASGFVNAVLRAVSRARTALPLPVRPADPHDRDAALQYLSITLSHPRWLVERWYDRIGFDATEQWLRFNNIAAPLTLRANRLRITPADLRDEAENRRRHRVVRCLCSRRADRARRPSIARPWRGTRAGSSCRTKPRSSSRCWPATIPDAACSTPARRPAARRRRWLPRWGRTI